MTEGLRVPADELEETDPHGEGLWMMTWRGAPFTGVAFSTHESGAIASETPFVDGNAHGRCTVHGPDGRLVRVFEMRHGMFVGEDRAWFPSGARHYERVRGPGRDFRERIWNEAGVLLSERADAQRLRRRWDPTGTLRSETLGDVVRTFARDGQLLVTIEAGARRYEDEAMEAHLFEALAEPDLRPLAMGHLRALMERDRPRAIGHLRDGLSRLSGFALVDLVQLVAVLGARELVPALEELTASATVPAPETTSTGGGRTGSRTIGEVARRALARLGP